jgi:hypothetical protein
MHPHPTVGMGFQSSGSWPCCEKEKAVRYARSGAGRLDLNISTLDVPGAGPVRVSPVSCFADMAPGLSYLTNFLSQICHPAQFTLATEQMTGGLPELGE